MCHAITTFQRALCADSRRLSATQDHGVSVSRRLMLYLASILSLALTVLAPARAQELISVIRAPDFYKYYLLHSDLSSDFNRNGTLDLAMIFVNAERTQYRFAVYESSTGAEIAAFPMPLQYGINPGWFSFKTGDVSGDGYPDIIPYFHKDGYCVDIVNGRTGETMFGIGASSPFSECGRYVDVADVNRDGKNELILFDQGYTGGEEGFSYEGMPDGVPPPYTSFVSIHSVHSTGGLQEACRLQLDAQVWGAPEGLLAGPDRNRDGFKDIYIGFPSASGGAGAVLVMSGKNCSLLATDTRMSSHTSLGGTVLPGGDLDQDGKPDLIVGSAQGYVRYGGATGTIVSANPVSLLGTSSTGDLNRDGVIDFISYRSLPQNSFSYPNSEGTIISGKTGNIIGAVGLTRVASAINTLFPINVDYSKFSGSIRSEKLSHPSFDANGDGISDFIVRANNIRLGLGSDGWDKTLYLVVSGTCPRAPEIAVTPANYEKVAVGEGFIEVSVWVCGKQYPMTLNALHNGKTIALTDDGAGEDRVRNDSVYGGELAYTGGVQKIGIAGVVETEVPFAFGMVQEVGGVPNYKAVGVSPVWIDPSDAGTLPGSTSESFYQEVVPPFPILYYGDLYTRIIVTSNGSVELKGRSAMSLPLGSLAETNAASRIIAPYQSSLEPGEGGRIGTKTVGAPGNRMYVITWEGYKHKPLDPSVPPEASRLTFQVVFSEGSPAVLMNYKQMYSSESMLGAGGGGVCKIKENVNLGSTFSVYQARLPSGSSVAFIPESITTSDPGGGQQGGGGNGGGETNPPAPSQFGVSFSAVYSPTAKTVTVDLFAKEVSKPQRVDLSKAGCSVEIYGGPRASNGRGTFKKLTTFALQMPLVSKRATNVPGLARQIAQASTGQSVVASVNLRATIRCRDGRVVTSKEVIIRPPTRYRGTQLNPDAWVKRVVKTLK